MILDPLGNLQRSHLCGDLRAGDAGKQVTLLGWVQRRRDLGQLIFLDVRDRSGITQVVANKEKDTAVHARADECRSEFVVAVEGGVVKREKSNPNLPTGEVEVVATKLHILNDARTPPFPRRKKPACATVTSTCAARCCKRQFRCGTKSYWPSVIIWIKRGSTKLRHRSSPVPPPRARATTSSRAGSTPDSSTPCRSRRKFSSSF